MLNVQSRLVLVILLLVYSHSSFAVVCSRVFSKNSEIISKDQKEFCFYAQCTRISYVSDHNRISSFGTMIGYGISLRYKESWNSKEEQIEGIIVKHGSGDQAKMMILTKEGLTQIQDWNGGVVHFVLFDTKLRESIRARNYGRVSLQKENILMQLDRLASEHANEYVHFDARVGGEAFGLVAKVKMSDDGFAFEMIDGGKLRVHRSDFNTEVSGDYMILGDL